MAEPFLIAETRRPNPDCGRHQMVLPKPSVRRRHRAQAKDERISDSSSEGLCLPESGDPTTLAAKDTCGQASRTVSVLREGPVESRPVGDYAVKISAPLEK